MQPLSSASSAAHMAEYRLSPAAERYTDLLTAAFLRPIEALLSAH
jgi:hypothetical protein